ncbi:MAG: hydrolase [Acidobacteria bacterium]|jgi:phosphoglycolate phosphatase-like HAD superfamily hydrolase|nr:hydrolase [Acidobacteriota bacterium]|tara:strand:+ start:796 stop:1488 length:693 start_codon:yes stop_codon:yes gene_type:complete
MKKLLLFDIDGTLLTTDGASGRAFESALIDVYGTAGPIGEVSFAGKTDPQIAYELLGHTEIPRSVVKARLGDLWTRYLKHFDNELVSSLVRPFPGVVECLNHVESKADQALMGLLTGNIEPGAQRKLDASGLGFSRFQVGAFGSDSENRDELPMIAAARAKALVGEHPESETLVIVGDTPADISCGKAVGARTIAVATGVYSRFQLEECCPDFLFDSLENTDLVWDAMIR